jgi:hypothetical protein
MIRLLPPLAVFVIVATFCARGLAQVASPAPASLPTTLTTAPATRPAYHVTVPPGFKKVVIESRTLIIQDADVKWVTESLEAMAPTTRPTTMPADMLDRLNAGRAALKQRMIADMGPLDAAAVDKLLGERMVSLFKGLDELDPRIIYLVTSPQTLKEIVKGGWSDPHFYYNRVADDVAFSSALVLSPEGGDENLLPALYDTTWSEADRKTRFAARLANTEMRVMYDVAMQAQRRAWMAFVQFIGEEVMAPLKPKTDQQWFTFGISSVLGARYAAQLIGAPAEEVLGGLSMDDPRNPIRPATVDLLHPADPAQLRASYLPAYVDAYNRKSVRAARALLTKAGEGAAAKVLAAWKTSPPADGAALVSLIKSATGVDVGSDLRPQ